LYKRGYHEPFIGGGAIFFKIEPIVGSINDINPRLMNFYKIVRDYPHELISKTLSFKYNKKEYYKLREQFNAPPENAVEDAALLLYLNRTCYNGLYRVNSKGKFNVPFGKYKNPKIVHKKRIIKASNLLQKIDIKNEDFSYIIDSVKKKDVCYFDPPYIPVSKTANFTNYSKKGFKIQDHKRLRDLCIKLDDKKVRFIQSNSNTDLVRELYDGTGFKLIPLKTKRLISSKISSRNSGNDLLIVNT
jgi:DNA adenine methylase